MRPRIVVFMGGQAEHANTSHESGSWVCQYIPRSKYDVTPVSVTHDGQWKVPMGSLPKSGDTARTIDMLFAATAPQDPKKAMERVLHKPVDSIITLMRGKGGDDGAMHALGDVLGIRVAGSGHHTSQRAYNKHHFAHAVSDIVPTPYAKIVRHTDLQEDLAEDIWSEFIPPFFIKPVHGSGSHGVIRIMQLEELQQALANAQEEKRDILVQEYRPGLELSVTIYSDRSGALRALPPTVITPKLASFYDYHEKQRNAGAQFHNVHATDSFLTQQAQAIAQEVYESMDCKGIATVDMIAHDGAVDVLELNTIPSFHTSSPIHHQLRQASMHPEQLLHSLFT